MANKWLVAYTIYVKVDTERDDPDEARRIAGEMLDQFIPQEEDQFAPAGLKLDRDPSNVENHTTGVDWS